MDDTPDLGRLAPQHRAMQTAIVVRPLQRLEAEYRETVEVLEGLTAGLDALVGEAGGGRAGCREVAPEPIDIDSLLAFQQQLAALPGVTDIVVVGSPEGGTRLVVQLEPSSGWTSDEPRIVCVQCGRTIAEGAGGISHGLCPGCVESFVQGNRK